MKAMRDGFLGTLLERMRSRDDIFFLTGDLGAPVLDRLRSECPSRFINVGIAEQNLVNVALGLALEGYRVYAYAIASFLTMRCYEQIRVGLALHSQLREVNVTLLGVGAGMSYDVSGPTHHCLEDLAILGVLPHLEIYSPSDAMTASALVDHALSGHGPRYVRLEGKPLPDLEPEVAVSTFDEGFRLLRPGRHLLVGTGYMAHKALRLGGRFPEGTFGVVDLLRPKPIRSVALRRLLAGASSVTTLEEGFLGSGGLDGLVAHFLRAADAAVPFRAFGLPDRYLFDIGSREYLHRCASLGDDQLIVRLAEVAHCSPVG